MNFWNYVVDVMPLESFCYTQGQKLRLRFADIPDLNQTSFFQQPKASPHKVSDHVSADKSVWGDWLTFSFSSITLNTFFLKKKSWDWDHLNQ